MRARLLYQAQSGVPVRLKLVTDLPARLERCQPPSTSFSTSHDSADRCVGGLGVWGFPLPSVLSVVIARAWSSVALTVKEQAANTRPSCSTSSHHRGNSINQGLTKKNPTNEVKVFYWAACALALFGFPRCGKFALPSQSEFDPSTHLSLNDIAIDSADSPSLIQLSIKQSKTDPFRKGVLLFWPRQARTFALLQS